MSGHSKWATIHRQKEVKDAKRGAVFTKMAAAIMVAVREGGGIGDPDKNFKLRLAVDKARQFNMPKENINRAIEKGTGKGGGNELEEVMYEGFLPGGSAVIAQAVTDNKARSAQQVRTYLEKKGGTLGGPGSVAYMFKPLVEIRVGLKAKEEASVQEQELEIIDLGVEDFQQDGQELAVYCHKDQSEEMKTRLENAGYSIKGMELVMVPENEMPVSDPEEQKKLEEILQGLEDLDDVTAVYSNYTPG